MFRVLCQPDFQVPCAARPGSGLAARKEGLALRRWATWFSKQIHFEHGIA